MFEMLQVTSTSMCCVCVCVSGTQEIEIRRGRERERESGFETNYITTTESANHSNSTDLVYVGLLINL